MYAILHKTLKCILYCMLYSYIIHWNGCGPDTVSANETSEAFISHFENMVSIWCICV